MKSFKDQYRECKQNGNLARITITTPVEVTHGFATMQEIKTLICMKYRAQCKSSVCKDERQIGPEAS